LIYVSYWKKFMYVFSTVSCTGTKYILDRGKLLHVSMLMSSRLSSLEKTTLPTYQGRLMPILLVA
jgi:hypothetical protein